MSWRLPAGLVGALATGAALRLGALDRNGLWLDELFTARAIERESWAAMVDELAADVHPPGYFGLLRLWVSVAGHGDSALRVPSALAGLATILATALLARRLAGDRAGLVAAWLAAVAPFLVTLDREARSNATLAALATCGLVLLSAPTPRRWIAYAAIAVALPWVHVFGLFVLLAHALYVGLECATGARSRGDLRPMALSLLAAALGLAPWLPRLLGQAQSYTEAPWYPEGAADSVASIWFALASNTTTLAMVLAAGAVIALARAGERVAALLGAHCLALVLLPQVVGWIAAPILRDRNAIALLPVMIACAAAGIASLRPLSAWTVAGLGLAAGAVVAGRGSFVDPPGEAWREAAATLATELAPGDVVVANHPNLWRHYLPPEVRIVAATDPPPTRDGARRMWLAQAHQVREEWIAAHGARNLLVKEWSFPGARLALFDLWAYPAPLAYDVPGNLREGDTIHFWWGARVHTLPVELHGRCAMVLVGWSDGAGGEAAQIEVHADPFVAEVVLPATLGVVRGPRWPLEGDTVAALRFVNDGKVGDVDRNAHLVRAGWDCQGEAQAAEE